ncbi:anthranilate phosphoribosyltransferase [Candidatus Poribacteria bacterium]|nr:MAG: anthranilate phosphoribosyltransferase [Candidatus Poribacteria bacterium]
MIRETIQKVVDGQDLTERETVDTMNEIMSGEATPAQVASFITALRIKGETIEEITGAARVMREKSTKIHTKHPFAVDTCGTGGDGSHSFNISTTAAFVVAGTEIPVAKHGNRAASSQSGSADVLKALGINIEIGPEQVGACIDDVGIGFLFAVALHGAMRYAIGPRQEIGIRTIFNALGPLTNPAGAQAQVLGVYAPTLTEPLANVLKNLDSQRAFVVHGGDGLDEITTTTTTQVSELVGGEVNTYTLDPTELGIPAAQPSDLKGGTPEENAEMTLSILRGDKGPKRDIVLLNAAAAIVAGGKAADIAAGLAAAAESVDSGRALAKLEGLKAKSNEAV